MTRIHSNNFDTTLNGGITNVATTMTLTSVTGFPTIGAGVTANLTIEDGSSREIVTATSRSSFVITMTRASEGTTGLAFSTGATVSLRTTADSLDRKSDLASPIFTGTVTAPTLTSTDTTVTGSLQIPNSAAPTVNANGEIAVDTTITDHKGLVKYYSGEEMVVVAMPTANLISTDTYIVGYDAATDAFKMVAPLTGAGTGDVVGPASATANNFCRFNSTTGKLIKASDSLSTLTDAGIASFGSYVICEATAIRIYSSPTATATNICLGGSTSHSSLTSATQCTTVGKLAAVALTAGDRCTALGYQALNAMADGDDNTACGAASMVAAVTGAGGNSALGSSSLSTVTNGDFNVGVGFQCGTANASGAAGLTTGTDCTLLGYRAGVDTVSSVGVIALGSNAVGTKATGSLSSDNGPGIAIGATSMKVGFRGDGTIYSAVGSSAGYWRVKINGTQYKIQLFADV